ncbi:MAG: MmcQ/YjbR family DNA-binding protein [Acidimicrobiia bacterium]|nr:MmcQ/YjbR family DNA-binding protein [Acidimicrobiia bacterium]
MTFDDVAALALELPEAVEGTSYGSRAWKVKGKLFAWERPFRKADLERFGEEPVPGGPILGLAVDDLEEKEVVLSQRRPGFFTIPHFDGYAAVLVQLDAADDDDVREAIVDAWLCKAPEALAGAYLDRESGS